MSRNTKVLVLGGIALVLGLQPIVFSQSAQQAPTVQRAPTPQQAPTMDQRVSQLELSISVLQSELQRRTAPMAGPDDRMSRDFNLDTRLTNIERQVQQLSNSVMELQRQIADATRAASQAQSDAMLAQQIARDAQARIN
jgi:uncharacterized protein YlxW (UPF0749 family)